MNFQQNKKDVLRKLDEYKHLKAKKHEENPEVEQQTPNVDDDKEYRVMLFCKKTDYMQTIIDKLNKTAPTISFDDSEQAIAFCYDNAIKLLVLDMDDPTDWKKSTDVFTGIKMLVTDSRIVCITKHPLSIPIQTLEAQKAIIIKKPFDMNHLLGALGL